MIITDWKACFGQREREREKEWNKDFEKVRESFQKKYNKRFNSCFGQGGVMYWEVVSSVTRKKSPNVYKGCTKMISLEKW